MLTHDDILVEMISQIDSGKVTQVEIASRLGIAPARITEIKKKNRKIQPHELHKLAALLGLTNGQTSTTSVVESVAIPVLGRVAAGVWMEQSFHDPDDCETVGYDRMAGDENEGELFAVDPEGDSMDLIIPANSRLICRRVQFGVSDVNVGSLIIVERQNHELTELTCKRLDQDSEGNFLLRCESSNPKYAEPISIPNNQDFTDFGITITGVVLRAVVSF